MPEILFESAFLSRHLPFGSLPNGKRGRLQKIGSRKIRTDFSSDFERRETGEDLRKVRSEKTGNIFGICRSTYGKFVQNRAVQGVLWGVFQLSGTHRPKRFRKLRKFVEYVRSRQDAFGRRIANEGVRSFASGTGNVSGDGKNLLPEIEGELSRNEASGIFRRLDDEGSCRIGRDEGVSNGKMVRLRTGSRREGRNHSPSRFGDFPKKRSVRPGIVDVYSRTHEGVRGPLGFHGGTMGFRIDSIGSSRYDGGSVGYEIGNERSDDRNSVRGRLSRSDDRNRGGGNRKASFDVKKKRMPSEFFKFGRIFPIESRNDRNPRFRKGFSNRFESIRGIVKRKIRTESAQTVGGGFEIGIVCHEKKFPMARPHEMEAKKIGMSHAMGIFKRPAPKEDG